MSSLVLVAQARSPARLRQPPRHRRRHQRASRLPSPLSTYLQLVRSTPHPAMEARVNASIPSAVNAFGEALFQQLQRQSSGMGSAAPPAALTISPFSIARALGMLLQGAAPGSPSQKQIASVVFGGAGVSDASSLAAFNAQLSALAAAMERGRGGSGGGDDGGGSQPTVADANSVWVRSGLELQQDFKSTLQDVFGAEAAPITTAAIGARGSCCRAALAGPACCCSHCLASRPNSDMWHQQSLPVGRIALSQRCEGMGVRSSRSATMRCRAAAPPSSSLTCCSEQVGVGSHPRKDPRDCG